MTDAATKLQPVPHGRGADIALLVEADIESRVAHGEKLYGERLRSHNGRDAMVDAYPGSDRSRSVSPARRYSERDGK